ncbi:MAG: xylulokinase [Chloroflexi bacterium]|nr:xylulokinase [Chloroflexota bacterium]
MNSQECLLGLDIGTSGLKCVLVDRAGQVLGLAFRGYAPNTPQPGRAEQDPETWVEAAVSAVREVVDRSSVDRNSIAGLGFSGQMHSTVCLDRDRRVLSPAILWLDRRSAPQVTALRERIGAAQLAQWIGNPIAPGFMLASLLWLKESEPATWDRLAHVLLPKDYVRFRLTGELGTDYSDASSTALLDVQHRTWCSELADAAGIPLDILPPLFESAAPIGHLTSQMADAMNLIAGLPVMCGAGDQEAQAIGNGLIRPGIVSCTIGTGGQLFTPIEQYQSDPQLRLHTFCHAIPNQWHWEAATLAAGLSLRWLRDEVLSGQYTYQAMADAAATTEPGAEGLIYLPYLEGERTPHMDPNARGVFCGLTLRHTWRHLTRAVMEGVVFSLLDGLDLMRSMGLSIERIVASGGGTQHSLWLQLQANIFDADVIKSETQEAAALGAALLAGIGVGVYSDFGEACEATVRYSTSVYQPRPAVRARYHRQAEIYRGLYRSLAPTFEDLAVKSEE